MRRRLDRRTGAAVRAPWQTGWRIAAGRAANPDLRPRPRGRLASPRRGARDCGARSRPACAAGLSPKDDTALRKRLPKDVPEQALMRLARSSIGEQEGRPEFSIL